MVVTSSTSALADKAIQLVQQLKRNPDFLPPYNDDIMRFCAAGVSELYNQCATTFQTVRNSGGTQESLQINAYRHEVIKFVIRCCSAYVNERGKRIKSYRWKYGGVLPMTVKNNLCESEIEFFNKYCTNLATFQVALGENGLDLMRYTHPPTTLYLQVRVLMDYGQFETSDGNIVMLKKSSIHSLPRQDCELLIKQGVFEIAK
ncbi:unnamed protein product [Auanema sp. JU1783]|nr:unnamed protein product [Auanema sp. JU1783]